MRTLPLIVIGALILAIASPGSAQAQSASLGPITCRYTPGQYFHWSTYFTVDQITNSPDTVLAGSSGSTHMHYTITGDMLFLIKAVASDGVATVQLIRRGSETLELSNGGQTGSTLPPTPPTLLHLAPNCTATSGLTASMSTSLAFLVALPSGPLHLGQHWTAHIRNTVLGPDTRPYTITTNETLLRTLMARDAAPGGTPAVAVSVRAHAIAPDDETDGNRVLHGRATITIAGTSMISTALHRVVGVSMSLTQRSQGSVARPFLPTVAYSYLSNVTFSAVDITAPQ